VTGAPLMIATTPSVETASLFFALLAVIAQAATVAALVLGAAALVGSTRARSALRAVRAEAAQTGRWLAAGVAAVCTAGSLWFSEVAGFPPCRLCWYQRFAMYPLIVVLAVAAGARGTRTGGLATATGAILAAAGLLTATWHVLIERFPDLEGRAACDPANPCSIIWVERFGYVTIPVMALSGFALILTLLALSRPPRS
jgi:disulfide bond formation protein DsbB